MKDKRYKHITPRMLLNHSSGLQGSTFNNSFLFKDNDTYAHDILLQQLSNQNLKADPGAFSVYCNDGFTLAEILVERINGMNFTEFLHQKVYRAIKTESYDNIARQMGRRKAGWTVFSEIPGTAS